MDDNKQKKYDSLENIEKLYKKLLVEDNPNVKNEEELKIHFCKYFQQFFDANNLPLN